MKAYKIIVPIFFVLLVQQTSYAQNVIFADKVVAATKAAIVAELALEIAAVNAQTVSYKALELLEKEYDDKRDASGFTASTQAMIAVVLYSIESTESQIEEVTEKAEIVKLSTLFVNQRIDGILGDLENEQKYLDEIQDDYKWLALGIEFGGGVGYTYTAFMKVLTRSMDVRRNVMNLDKEIKNLNTINKFFIRE